MYSVERVASMLVPLPRHLWLDVFVGNMAKQMCRQYFIAPAMTERQLAMMTDRLHLDRD